MTAKGNSWCLICCTQHGEKEPCLGDLMVTGDERHGWRVRVQTPHGLEAYGVLVAQSRTYWRARILTYPKILWMIPGGGGALKFVGRTPREAERKAAEFIRTHCRRNEYEILHSEGSVPTAYVDTEGIAVSAAGSPASRKIRFLPVQYGVVGPTEKGRTGNLSESGLFIITGAPVDEGKSLDLLLSLQERKVTLRGNVRWARKGHHVGRSPGMGIQLDSPPSRYIRYVQALS